MKNKETELFESLDEAIRSWSNQYRPLSQEYEHGAFIYQRKTSSTNHYRIGRTIKGTKGSTIFRPNVVFAFLYFYAIESIVLRILHHDQVVVFIHTHPKPPQGYSYRKHSNEDLGLLKLKRIKEVIVVPFENLEVNREVKSKPSA